jgi:peptide/nickel transport system substrate-binding protein
LFDNGKGREVVAEDIKHCFTTICTQDPNNQSFSIFKDILKGANKYDQASAGG